MGQFVFDLESGGHMQSNEDVVDLFLRCSAFPSYKPFTIVTDAPTVRLRCFIIIFLPTLEVPKYPDLLLYFKSAVYFILDS